jgi:hypothetical protein
MTSVIANPMTGAPIRKPSERGTGSLGRQRPETGRRNTSLTKRNDAAPHGRR